MRFRFAFTNLVFPRWIAFGGAAVALAAASSGCQFSLSRATMAVPDPGVSAPIVTLEEQKLLSDVPNALQYANHGSIPAQVKQDPAAGPGIVVCSAVVSGGDANLSNFAEGCAAWLQLNVGGQPQFGRTPSWHAPIRASQEMNQPGLHLNAGEAKSLARICGATHSAVATLTSSGAGAMLLSYQLVKTSDGSPVGGAITAQGTPDQIATQLPSVAAQLCRRLGLAKPSLPPVNISGGNDLEFLGRCRWSGSLSDTDTKRLDTLAHQNSNALAAVLDFSGPKRYSLHEKQAMIDLAMLSAPGNVEIDSEVGDLYPDSLSSGERSVFASLAKRYPHNFAIDAAQTHALESESVPQQAKIAAGLAAACCNVLSPDAWSVAAGAYSRAAKDIRHARLAEGLSSVQWSQLNHLYDYFLGCSERSIHLDGADAHMWNRVASAATFDNQDKEADVAERHALSFEWDLNESYSWGLDMYQPKWGGDPAKLSALSDTAAADTRLSPKDLLDITDSDGGYDGLIDTSQFENMPDEPNVKTAYETIINVAVRRLQPMLKVDPDNAELYEQLGNAYNALNQQADARNEYELAAGIAPNDPDIRYRLADQLYNMHFFGEALTGYLAVARLEPEYPLVHFDIGYAYKERGNFPAAVKELNEELRQTPTSAAAYMGLGDVYSLQKNDAEATKEWLNATRYDPWQWDAWNSAASALDSLKEYQRSIAAAKQGLSYFPTDSQLYITMEDDYLKLHHPEITLQLCNQDLEFDKAPENSSYSYENIAEADLEEHKIGDAQREWQFVIKMGEPNNAHVARNFLAKYPTGQAAVAPPS